MKDTIIDWFGGPILLLIIAGILLGVMSLTGCGGSSGGVSHAPSSDKTGINVPKDVMTHSLSTDDYYDWSIVKVHMPSNKDLLCIKAEAHDDYPLTISCNWEAYNKGLTQ